MSNFGETLRNELQQQFRNQWGCLVTEQDKSQVLYDVSETDTEDLVVSVNVMGHKPENVDVEVINGILQVTTEPSIDQPNPLATPVKLAFELGRDYNTKSIDASIELGILTLQLTKKVEKKPNKVKIKY